MKCKKCADQKNTIKTKHNGNNCCCTQKVVNKTVNKDKKYVCKGKTCNHAHRFNQRINKNLNSTNTTNSKSKTTNSKSKKWNFFDIFSSKKNEEQKMKDELFKDLSKLVEKSKKT